MEREVLEKIIRQTVTDLSSEREREREREGGGEESRSM